MDEAFALLFHRHVRSFNLNFRTTPHLLLRLLRLLRLLLDGGRLLLLLIRLLLEIEAVELRSVCRGERWFNEAAGCDSEDGRQPKRRFAELSGWTSNQAKMSAD